MKDFLTIEEIAFITGLSKRSVYMHFYRGHLVAHMKSRSHRLYFSKVEVLRFMSEYYPNLTI